MNFLILPSVKLKVFVNGFRDVQVNVVSFHLKKCINRIIIFK